MASLSLSKLANCLSNGPLETGTRIHNLTDSPIELQIRVGSTTKRVHTLKPGSSKRVKSKSLYNASMKASGVRDGSIENGMSYYDDESWHPYVLIHDAARGGFSRMLKQQYASLEDLRDCSEIRVYRDHQRGCISIRKKARHTEI